MESTKQLVTREIHAFSLSGPRLAIILPAIFVLGVAVLTIMSTAGSAQAQASWVGDVVVDGEPSNLWADCLPCTELTEPPNTNWSTDRIPGDDGPLGDPGTGAVIGPDFVVDHNGGTLDLSTLDVQGGLTVGGLINISDSATINNIDLESGGALAGPGPVTLTGSGTWNGALRSGGGVTNAATLTAVTGNLEADLVNNATLIVNPSLDFTSTPSTLTNNLNIFLNTDTALNNNSDILDSSGAANLLLNLGTIAKSGADLSVIEAPGNHAGGLINASDGTLRFFRNDWQFSGGSMQVGNNGQIELTGNVDHVINGTPGINGQGSLLVNMNTFGTLTVTEPFVVDVTGSGDHGLLLQGVGIVLDSNLTTRRGGQWRAGTISGDAFSSLMNLAPSDDPFLIVPAGSKALNVTLLRSFGWIQQTSSVVVNDGAIVVESAGGLVIEAMPNSVDWLGNGNLTNRGIFELRDDAFSTVSTRFSQVAGRLVAAGELRLTGGGFWAGANEAIVRNNGFLEFRNSRFEFTSGSHRLSEENSTRAETLLMQDSEMIAVASDASVIFDLDFASLDGGGLGGIGRFENQHLFAWRSGEFGIDGSIDFLNTENSILSIISSGNLLDGRLENRGRVFGGLSLTSGAVVKNLSEWTLSGGSSSSTIGTTEPGSPGVFDNPGGLTMLAANGDQFQIDSRLNNSGTIRLGSPATLRINGPVDQLQDGVLSGGNWELGRDSILIFPEAVNTIGPGTAIRGMQAVDGIETLALILGGEASVSGNMMLDGLLELGNGARITVDGESSVTVPGGIQNGAPGDHTSITELLDEAIVIASAPDPSEPRVTASTAAAGTADKAAATGTVTPLLTTPMFDNHAILAAGGIGLPGPFNLDGELVMHPGSTLDIDLAGATPVVGHDQLAVTGPITLAGTVQITVAEDFFPAVGQPFVIATAGQGMTGMIDAVVNANREDIVWSITETADEVIVEAVEVERIFESGFEA